MGVLIKDAKIISNENYKYNLHSDGETQRRRYIAAKAIVHSRA